MQDTVLPPFNVSNISSTNGFFSDDDNTIVFIIPRIGDIVDNFVINCNMNNISSYKITYHQSPSQMQLENRYNKTFAEQVIDKKIIEYEIMAMGCSVSFGFNTNILLPPILFSKIHSSAIITISVTFAQCIALKDLSKTKLTFRYRQYDLEMEQDKIAELDSLSRVYSNFDQHQYFSTYVRQKHIDISGVQNIFLPFINFIGRLIIRIDDMTIQIRLLYGNKNRVVENGTIEINETVNEMPLQLSVMTENAFTIKVFGYSRNILVYENGFVSTGFPSIFTT